MENKKLDIFSKEKRSEVMSKIRSRNTKIELLLFRELRKRKIYFRKHYQKVNGKPDIALPSKKKAVFVDGDFWHGYKYKTWKMKLKSQFWYDKIENTMRRDARNRIELKKKGWKVLRIWEHEIKKDLVKTIDKILLFLKD